MHRSKRQDDYGRRSTWEALKAIPLWAPLSSLGIKGLSPIAEDLYRISPQIYLFAHHEILTEAKVPGPYVTILLWAESDGAAKRAMLQDLEADKDRSNLAPPAEMLYQTGCVTYRQLIAHLKHIGKFQPYTVTGSYRIIKGGDFTATHVNVDNWVFMFRSQKVKAEEPPFAIQFRLKARKETHVN